MAAYYLRRRRLKPAKPIERAFIICSALLGLTAPLALKALTPHELVPLAFTWKAAIFDSLTIGATAGIGVGGLAYSAFSAIANRIAIRLG